jgi:hypothetical protein
MNYQEIEIDNLSGVQKHIIIELGDGSFKSFPADENNPEYMAWLNPETTFVPDIPKVVDEMDSDELADEPSSDTE